MINIHPNILEKNGKKQFAILPYSEFIKIQNELEDYEDLKLLRQAKRKEADSPTLSMDEAKARLLTKRVVKQLKKRG
jgi:PHD/YefM family antitoxin component YafN of YafNO toxin-antitoxin module